MHCLTEQILLSVLLQITFGTLKTAKALQRFKANSGCYEALVPFLK